MLGSVAVGTHFTNKRDRPCYLHLPHLSATAATERTSYHQIPPKTLSWGPFKLFMHLDFSRNHWFETCSSHPDIRDVACFMSEVGSTMRMRVKEGGMTRQCSLGISKEIIDAQFTRPWRFYASFLGAPPCCFHVVCY